MTESLSDNYVKPDGWDFGSLLAPSDGWSDSSFPGCDYRLPAGLDYQLAVNISITGRKSHALDFGRYRTRVKIEFVGDGEPSQFSHGWIYTDQPLIREQ